MLWYNRVQQSNVNHDWALNKITNWQLKFCWIPQRCFLSNKSIWARKAYYGIRMITGPGEPVYEHRWVDSNEFILWQLQKGY